MSKEIIRAKLQLKDPIIDEHDKPLKNFSNIDPFKKDMKSGQLVQKTQKEIESEATSVYTHGEILVGILMNGISPSNVSEAAMLNRFAKKISNVMARAKGEWEVDEEIIDQLIKLVGKAEMKPGVQLTLGAVADMLEQAKETIVREQAKRDLK